MARLGRNQVEDELRAAGVELIEAPFTIHPKPRATVLWRACQQAAQFVGSGYDIWHSFHYLDDYTEPLIARFAQARAWVFTKKNMSWNRRSWLLRSHLASGIAAQNTDMIRDFFASPRLNRKTRYIPSGARCDQLHPVDPWLRWNQEHPGRLRRALVARQESGVVDSSDGESVPGVEVLLAGRSDDLDYVAHLVEQIGILGLGNRVSLLGAVDDVVGFLQSLDVFVFPSLRSKGCPVALLEAMSAGLACVATDVPGNRDLIESGESGLLVPVGDPGMSCRGTQQACLVSGIAHRPRKCCSKEMHRSLFPQPWKRIDT